MASTIYGGEDGRKTVELIGGPLDGHKLELAPLFPQSSGLPATYTSLLEFVNEEKGKIYYTQSDARDDHYVWSKEVEPSS